MATKHSRHLPHLLDLTGQRFGDWVVVGLDEARGYTDKAKTTYWICRCVCGSFRSLRGQHLRKGACTNCGCRFRGIDHTGQRFGRLTVIERRGSRNGKVFWLCRCDCGTAKEVSAERLRTGNTTSCGCYQRERAACSNKRHGQSNTRQYHSWNGMIRRCIDLKNPAFPNYGGRGVYVCERWLHSAAAFLEDMGPQPDKDSSIDRIDNNGNYTCGKCRQCRERNQPANCRWASRFEQSCNRRTNRLLTYGGETLTVREWCLRTGLKRSTIEVRLRLGWDVARILTTPLRPSRPLTPEGSPARRAVP